MSAQERRDSGQERRQTTERRSRPRKITPNPSQAEGDEATVEEALENQERRDHDRRMH